MTGNDDFDRTLADWFDGEALPPAPAGGLARVLDATRRRRPAPAWFADLGSHWVGAAPRADASAGEGVLPRVRLRWSTALLLLLAVAAIVGGAIVAGARMLQHSPLPAGRLGHLAYGLDGDIFVADWDGRNSVRVADGLPGDGMPTYLSPTWSPDGRHLAYRSWGGSTFSGTVFIAEPTGRVVGSFAGAGWSIAWSPDSTRVATWVDLDGTIGVYGLDGARQALLTVPPGFGTYRDEDPVWSRDGGSLLISLRPVPGGDPRQTWELPIDGRTPLPLPSEDMLHTVYSPDGARIATAPFPGPSPDSASLLIAEADGTGLRTLPGAAVAPCALRGPCGPQDGAIYEDPVWSPTGDRVAFTWSVSVAGSYFDKDGYPAPRPHELRVVDVASGTVTRLAGASQVAAVMFSPEGDRILFSSTDADGVESLRSVNADGSDARLLVTGTNSGAWQRLPAGQ